MLLAIDIGNSNIVLGIYEQNQWTHIWRIETSLDKNANAYATDLSYYFLENQIKVVSIQQMIMSSVVPDLIPIFRNVLSGLLGQEPVVLNVSIYPKLKIQINNPEEIGSDLVANAVAAHHFYHEDCIIVDFGTALTFTTISKEGEILGVAIAPGLKTAIKSLFRHTAQLPEVPMSMPDSALGQNTVEAIQAGVILGYSGLVEFMVRKIEKELNVRCKVIATGGLSVTLEPIRYLFDDVDINLTLNGLRLIAEAL
jgi:type III pantothenate kinase